MIFTDWLYEEIQKRNWTQTELASRAGITKGAVSHIFSHTRHPGTLVLKAIAKALHLPPEEVFRRAGVLDTEPDPGETPRLGEWIQIFRDADESTREQMLENARALTDGEPRRKRA
ncbi:MAG TPA: helix-turn-helix transcriptional regulator [Anaerolineales bacterium]|jgi:transcriptional regulator with XRE-family HTH domain